MTWRTLMASGSPTSHASAKVVPLQVRNLSVQYEGTDGRSVQVLSDLDFGLAPATMTCLVGRSGSGKTSVLRQVVGLAEARESTVWWGDRDIASFNNEERASLRRRQAAYVDQQSGLVEELTLLENSLLALYPNGKAAVRRARPGASALLDEMGLTSRADWRPAYASGGERQRVALARALLSGAPTIVADEPTSSLDSRWASAVIGLLRDHADRGGSVLVASHDPAVAAASESTVVL